MALNQEGGLNQEGAAQSAPVGVITFGVVSVTEDTTSVPFSYDASDESGYEYQLDGGAITSATSPISLTGLTGDTSYTIKVRAINASGSGDWFSESFTTEAATVTPVVPQGTVTVGTVIPTRTTVEVNFTYSDTDTSGYKYRLNSGSPVDIGTTNPFTISGLTADTNYSIEVLAYNATGDGSYSVASNFTTEADVVNDVAITSQPQDGSVNKDISSSSLVLTVTNTGNATYQWQRLVSASWVDISGETSSSLVIEGGDFDSIGTEYYRVELFNGVNAIQSIAAEITIEEQPFTPAETSTLSGSISKIPDGNYTFTFYNENDNTFIVKKSVYFFNEYFSQELDVPSGTTVLYSTPRTSGDDTGASNYGVTT